MSVLRELEALFQDSEQRVLAAFVVRQRCCRSQRSAAQGAPRSTQVLTALWGPALAGIEVRSDIGHELTGEAIPAQGAPSAASRRHPPPLAARVGCRRGS